MSQNNLGYQTMTWATQFSTIGGLVGDPWIWAYPQHRISESEYFHQSDYKKVQ